MINLIPDHLRANNHYAIKNVRLLRYGAVAALTMLAIAGITALSIFSMTRTEKDLEEQINSQSQKLSAYKPLEAKGKKLTDQISTINKLLDRQVTFSTLLPDLAKILPPGAILKQLDFSTADILPAAPTPKPPSSGSSGSGSTTPAPTVKPTEKPFVILAGVTDRTVAATLLENIQARADLFTSADIVDITQQTSTSSAGSTGTPSSSSRYPYQVTINAYLKKKTQTNTPSSGGNQ